MAQQVNEADFDAEVLQSTVPVLVDFYADWCAPCRQLAPLLDELSTESQGAYKVVKINTDENRDLAIKYDVSALPTLKVFKSGSVSETFVGIKDKQTLSEALSG